MKFRVYTTTPQDIHELRRKITEQFDNLKLNPNFVRNAVRAMRSRARLCFQKNGGHVEGVEH